ncbi:MAG: hypothetical protein A3J07_00995 [Candidatus Doudnabacteria bacterium RIFCSPLOWO2_02_FULL_49_13]|nr:MAG: hypothetical protein A3B77_03925 [Candidatus Doudnabacteria bacterium RIFCSPHIGHO2_02_FULL_49_24]OGE88636.1 MAG: hypothetical protein A2760_01585 [Candidatus Doudnabacteria bacterium RIFCSPHIGHO2_01_FULL_50_67]OGE97028.1 MAG: hypothetical protein A2990_01495 [Candidatus Doudnabacteria bacterium RIFCSPLOWO2_01_FULL_49_40]OGF02377.1 MAG: hypothetical protein A3J07_00995 [Candidatus Doudnabacteria bacterium RIFCSPLOWO2_02_FULL_49_13]OGF03431.1 MAG: hypothetical protein A3H14_01405 [Candida
MKIIIYYLVLLILIALLTGFLVQGTPDSMSMEQIISVSLLLGVYVVAISLVGEGKIIDERDMQHRYTSNRLALIAGTVILSIGVLVQLFNHALDYWLLAGLIAINLVKIVSLIYSNYRH